MSKITLKDFQQEVIDSTNNLNRCAYYYDMGLGKTFIGSYKLEQLGENVNLVVCQKSKVDDWVNHFKEFHSFRVFDLTKKSEFDAYFSEKNAKLGVLNYDIVWRRKELLSLTGFTLMLDESSYIKNDKAKRTKTILKMKCKNVILLSGTPTGGKYEELYSQCRLLGWNISRKKFWEDYIIYKMVDFSGTGIKQPLILGYKNVDALKENLYKYGARFKKTEEVMSLPEQTFINVMCKPNTKYKKFVKDEIVEIDGEELVGDTTLTKMLYERQLCSFYSKNKLEKLKSLLESTNNRVVIFYNFKKEYNAIAKICEDLQKPISTVNGTFKDLSNFEKDNCVVLVQYQSGAMGLNLQKSNIMIYFSLPLSSELFEQSKKRIHRIGQDKPCLYYVMICKDSLEEQIYENLQRRRDFTDRLFESCQGNYTKRNT